MSLLQGNQETQGYGSNESGVADRLRGIYKTNMEVIWLFADWLSNGVLSYMDQNN